jgi:uncharacterized protein
MILEGVITNVANFGAFIDIGVHQDGLIHISELSNTYVSDPKTVVKAGQVVKVRVLKIDADLKRVALSMKLEAESGTPPPRHNRPNDGQRRDAHGRDGYRKDARRPEDNRGRPAADRPPARPPVPKNQPTVQSLKEKFGKPDSGKPPLKMIKPVINIKRLLP